MNKGKYLDTIVEILKNELHAENIYDNTNLIDEGLLDSLSTIALVASLDDELGIEIPMRYLIPENFETPSKIEDLILRIENEDK
ncbi:MAG: acyl carrier protein [Clostridia bacterium]|nr:acyl carrier protein [Clostridia bacterium]MBR3621473.1 acyl carrier protein [Clostridia bacterium]MBR6940236.1 acyl carrier protein [Clostridia bacterium]